MIRDLNIGQVRNELLEARQQLASKIGLRDEAYVEQAADAMDQVQAAEAREFALRSLDRYARRLRQVEAALRRLEVGPYGVCEDCEEEISGKRLRAVPWAQRCVKCEEVFEQRALGVKESDPKILANAA